MRDLLSRRQDEQLQKRTASGELPQLASTHGQLRELRRELNALVSATHHKSGKPHGWIHNELRRRHPGPPVAAATREQLQDRIAAIRNMQRELTA